MKRIRVAVVLVLALIAGLSLAWLVPPRQGSSAADQGVERASGPRSVQAGGEPSEEPLDAAAARAAGVAREGAEESPELAMKRARAAEADSIAEENRRALFAQNIASVDRAIAAAEAEGADPEYTAALQRRRALLQEQAEQEEEQGEPEN